MNWPANGACAAAGGNTPNALYFPGTTTPGGTPHLDWGKVYDDMGTGGPISLGQYAQLSMIVKPMSDQWILSGSTGALHPWLFGFSLDNGIHLATSGNFCLSNGSSTPTFTGIWYPARIGEWLRFDRLLSLDGGGNALVNDYINGLKVMYYQWTAAGSGINRGGPPAGSGGGNLWTGHSNHQGATFYAANQATWEKTCPYGPTPNNFGPGNFVPSRLIDISPGGDPASMYHLLQGDQNMFPDMSATWNNGLAGVQRAHSAFKSNGLPSTQGITGFPNGYPVPTSIYDPDCPVLKTGDIVIPTLVGTGPAQSGGGNYQPAVPAVPAGSGLRCFDYFLRPDDGSQGSIGQQDGLRQALTGPNMGKDDPRSPIGQATWSQGPIQSDPPNIPTGWSGAMAIQYGEGYGAARCYSVQPYRMWRDVGTADHCALTRRLYAGTYPYQGVSSVLARMVDKDNFLTVFTYANSYNFFYRRYNGGSVAQEVLCTPTEQNYELFGLWCNGTTVKAIVESAAGVALTGLPGLWEIVNTFTDVSPTSTATKAGLLGNAGGAGVYANGLWAAKEFRCYTATP